MEKGIREKIEHLVYQAEQLMEESSACYSKADKDALMDMVIQAKKALDGEKPGFTRNREFLLPREEEAVQFAYDRYTMVPTFFEEGKVYSHYGLKEAISWFQKQDMSKWTEEQRRDRKEEILKKGKGLLEGAVCKNTVGMYDETCKRKLEEQIERLENVSDKELPQQLADAVDALIGMQFSQKLYSDQEKDPILLISKEKLDRIRQKGEETDFVQKQCQLIKEIAQKESLEESRAAYEWIGKPYEYKELNEKFYIWGDTGRVVNISTPKGTKEAKLSFSLPCMENEEEGLGHIQITGIRLFCADGPEVEIPNGDFGQNSDGELFGWRIIKKKGNAICRQEKSKEGESSLFLCNPTPLDEGVVECEKWIPLKETSGYTLFFRAKQDGKFRKGLIAKLEFFDQDKNKIGEFTYYYNRKSSIPVNKKAKNMQCNAILYALEGKIEYAQKAKYDMLVFLNDFCQGAEYWMVYNERPEGCDAYGAVQAGRIMCSAASTYSLIRCAAVFSEEEKQFFYQLVDYLLRYCLDMRDRISMSEERVQRGSSNWQTDMCIGVALLMMVLSDYPNRKFWLYNAEAVLKAQLSVNLNPDGSWPESIRYHHAALEHFASFAAAWKQETGEDWLVTTRLKDMFSYTIHTITPPYTYFGGRIGTPPFGDHKLSGGTEFGIYGLSIEWMEQVDKKLADQMYQVWKMAQYPVKALSGESLIIENLLYLEPSAYQMDLKNTLLLQSTAAYPDSGIYIFRCSGQEQKENYLAVMGAEKPIGHGHLDQGSFLLYYHNVPVIMDSGIEGYFDASTQWHLSSYSHACVQFAATKEEQKTMRSLGKTINLNAGNFSLDRGWLDVPRVCEVKQIQITKEKDRITLEIAHPNGKEKGLHQRTIWFEKKTGEVLVQDRIRDYTGKILFSLPIVMQSAWIEDNMVYGEGYEPILMKVEFLTPIKRIWLEKGRTTPMFPCKEDVPMLFYIRAEVEVVDRMDGIDVRIQMLEK